MAIQGDGSKVTGTADTTGREKKTYVCTLCGAVDGYTHHSTLGLQAADHRRMTRPPLSQGGGCATPPGRPFVLRG